MQKIVPHLWFDKEGNEAAEFYISLFNDSKIKNKTVLNNTPSGTAELLTIELAGQDFMLISAGPYFKFTPAVSFLISCNSIKEVEELWEKLIVGGSELMPLGSYPFSEKYGWLADRFGLSWQVMFTGEEEITQKITPMLMFVGDNCGKADEAINYYSSTFKNSKIDNIQRYGENPGPDKPDFVKRAEFTLENQKFWAMDSAYNHEFAFNEAISFLINCDTQEEIDYYWEKLSRVPEAEACGWVKDSYGLSWQINPSIMEELLNDKDQEKVKRVTEAFLKMKKFDIKKLKKAYKP